MLHAGLDLSRKRLDVCLLTDDGELVGQFAAPADGDGLRGLADRVGALGLPVRAAVESMNGARFVHDTLERQGWDVVIADAQKVKGLAPLACKTDRIDARVSKAHRSSGRAARSPPTSPNGLLRDHGPRAQRPRRGRRADALASPPRRVRGARESPMIFRGYGRLTW